MTQTNPYMLFAGTSHPELAKQIADCLGISLGKALIETFPDGEIGVRILESVRGRDVFIVQSTARHPNFYLMELLILVDAFKRASARSIIAVIPYYGYARQDRRGKEREPITAKLVADLLQRAGVTRVLTMDLHTEQIQGFFDIPVDNLYAWPSIVETLSQQKRKKSLVVVAPDIGSIKLARAYAEAMKVDLAIVDKRRVTAQQVQMAALIGDVKGKAVLLVDDMWSTGGTLKTAARVCKHAGAEQISVAATHGLFVGDGFEDGEIEKIVISNTVPVPEKLDQTRLQIVSVAPLFGKAIKSIVGAKSISSLYS